MELNKVIQYLKVEVETIKKKMEANLEMENLGKRSGITGINISNRILEIEEYLRSRRYHRSRRNGHNRQRKCKMQQGYNLKHPINPGCNEKTKFKDYGYKREQSSKT